MNLSVAARTQQNKVAEFLHEDSIVCKVMHFERTPTATNLTPFPITSTNLLLLLVPLFRQKMLVVGLFVPGIEFRTGVLEFF